MLFCDIITVMRWRRYYLYDIN